MDCKCGPFCGIFPALRIRSAPGEFGDRPASVLGPDNLCILDSGQNVRTAVVGLGCVGASHGAVRFDVNAGACMSVQPRGPCIKMRTRGGCVECQDSSASATTKRYW